ncbi:hypothetical protein MS3_00010809, partial [Schistosoma haematobium]
LENVTFENSSYRCSQHYMYLQRISNDPFYPFTSVHFHKYTDPFTVKPQLSFKYYSSQVKYLTIAPDGIGMHGDDYLGYIEPFIPTKINPVVRISDTRELFVVRWFMNKEIDGRQFTPYVTCLIHPNGRIVLYYDRVTPEIKEIEWKPKIVGKFECGRNTVRSKIMTPETWIRSYTLVEYEFIGNYCPKYTSPESCQNPTTLNITCLWCDKLKLCIDSTDNDAHNTNVNECRVKVSNSISSAGEFPEMATSEKVK